MKKIILFLLLALSLTSFAQKSAPQATDDLGVPIKKHKKVPDKITYNVYATQDLDIDKEVRTKLSAIDESKIVVDIKNDTLAIITAKGINRGKILKYDFKGTSDDPVLRVFIDDKDYEYVLFYNQPKEICFWPRLQKEPASIFLFSEASEN